MHIWLPKPWWIMYIPSSPITSFWRKLVALHTDTFMTDSACACIHPLYKIMYRQISNINLTLEGIKLVAHTDKVGASPVGTAPTSSSFSTNHHNRLGKDSFKMRRETLKFCELAYIRILKVCRYCQWYRVSYVAWPTLKHWPWWGIVLTDHVYRRHTLDSLFLMTK